MSRGTGRPAGRPPKPVAKKVAEGNLGKRKLPEAELVEEIKVKDIPAPPEHFTEEAVKLWVKVWSGGKSWLKTDRDFLTLELLCEAYAEYQFLRRMLKLGSHAGGVDRVVLSPKGYPTQHPYVSQRNEAERKMVTYVSILGFSPTDFARLQIAEVNGEQEELIKRLLAR